MNNFEKSETQRRIKEEAERQKSSSQTSNLESLSDQINKEIDEQREKLVKAIEKKEIEEIKAEYKKMVEILAKKLALETKFIDQKLEEKNLAEEKRKFLLTEKDNLLEDYKKTITGLACEIDESLGI